MSAYAPLHIRNLARTAGPLLSACLLLAFLAACGPTGNRLNTGVIVDPRLQPDSGNTGGNQGAIPPNQSGDTSAATPATPPSNLVGGVIIRQQPDRREFHDAQGQLSLSIASDGRFSLTTADPAVPPRSGRWRRHRQTIELSIDAPPASARTTLFHAMAPTDGLLVVTGDILPGHTGLLPMLGQQHCPDEPTDYVWLSSESGPPLWGLLNYRPASGQIVPQWTLHGTDNGSIPPTSPLIHPPCAPRTTSLRAFIVPASTQALPLADLAGRFDGLLSTAGSSTLASLACDDNGHCLSVASTTTEGLSWQVTAIDNPQPGLFSGRVDRRTDTSLHGLDGPFACLGKRTGAALSALVCHGRLADGTDINAVFQRRLQLTVKH